MKHFYKAVVIPYEKYKRINEDVKESKDNNSELIPNKIDEDRIETNIENKNKENNLSTDKSENSISLKSPVSRETTIKNNSKLKEFIPPPPGIRNSKIKKNKKPILKKSKKDIIKKNWVSF